MYTVSELIDVGLVDSGADCYGRGHAMGTWSFVLFWLLLRDVYQLYGTHNIIFVLLETYVIVVCLYKCSKFRKSIFVNTKQ